jgi:hypothetical protein
MAAPSPQDPFATATELRRLARQPRLAQIGTQLGALADAVDPNLQKDAHNWAAVDLFPAFLHEDAVSEPRRVWLARALDIWVQVLFFAPIIITWIGLMEATRAYRQMVKVKAFATESFLEGWQSGFHGRLAGAFYLDQVAFYVVLAIAVLVGSMIVQSIYRSKVDEDEPAKLYQELARALTAAQVALAPIRLSSPRHIAEELHDATAGLAKSATAIREAGETARSTQQEASKGLTAVSAALTEVQGLAKTVQAAAGNVDKASHAIEQRLAEIKSTTSAIVDAETNFVQQIGQHSTNLSTSTNGLAASIKGAVEGNQQQMSAAVEGSSAKIAATLDTGAGQIRSALTEITVAGAQYTHQVEQAADVLGLADDAVNKLPGAIAELQQRVIEMGDRIGDLGKAIGEAKDAMPSPAAIPADFQAALRDLNAAATALRSASVALREGPQQWSPGPPQRRWFFGRRRRP